MILEISCSVAVSSGGGSSAIPSSAETSRNAAICRMVLGQKGSNWRNELHRNHIFVTLSELWNLE
jgi:hypothetical protein